MDARAQYSSDTKATPPVEDLGRSCEMDGSCMMLLQTDLRSHVKLGKKRQAAPPESWGKRLLLTSPATLMSNMAGPYWHGERVFDRATIERWSMFELGSWALVYTMLLGSLGLCTQAATPSAGKYGKHHKAPKRSSDTRLPPQMRVSKDPQRMLCSTDTVFSIPTDSLLSMHSGSRLLAVQGPPGFPPLVAMIRESNGYRTLHMSIMSNCSLPLVAIGPLPAPKDMSTVIRRLNSGAFGTMHPSACGGQEVHRNGRTMLSITPKEQQSMLTVDSESGSSVAHAAFQAISMKLTILPGNEPVLIIACVIATLLTSPTQLVARAGS